MVPDPFFDEHEERGEDDHGWREDSGEDAAEHGGCGSAGGRGGERGFEIARRRGTTTARGPVRAVLMSRGGCFPFSPMPAHPLHCKHCQGVFLPASDQRWAAVQCPHCSGQMKIGDCAAAVEVKAGGAQVYVRVTEQAEAAAQADWRHHRWAGKMVVLGFAGLVVTAVVLAWHFLADRGRASSSQKKAGDFLQMEDRKLEGEFPGATAVAGSFLTARDWRGMLPWVSDAGRVESGMAWHYERHDFKPAAGPVRVLDFKKVEVEGRELLRVQAEATGGRPVWLLLVQEGGVWKVDWEVFANAPGERWAAFLREPAGSVLELPLLVARKPAADAYIIRAGASPVTHEALVLWAADRESLAGAVLAKEAADWKLLTGIGYDDAVKVIARVRMEQLAAEPPLVRLEGIVQSGWMRSGRGK